MPLNQESVKMILPHLRMDSFYQPQSYSYPKQVFGPKFDIQPRDRTTHGNALLKQLNNIQRKLLNPKEEPLPQGIVRDDVIYVEFISDWNFFLKFDSLNQDIANPGFQLLNINEDSVLVEGIKTTRFRAVVMMTQGGIGTFIKKIKTYLTKNVRDREGNLTDKPKLEALINNISSIELATLKSFWTDAPRIPFPDPDERIWWEVWFRKSPNNATNTENITQNLSGIGAQLGVANLEFPEHTVKLVKANARQLSASIFLLDSLAELRKPQEVNNFITADSIDFAQKKEWLQDLLSRTDLNINASSVMICLLDSGVNNQHPLIAKALPNNRLYTYKQAWGTNDSWPDGGHGTAMAGLSLYGDLTTAMASPSRISIFHGLESFKIIFPNDPHDQAFYGALTEYACALPITNAPDNPRVFCLAITDPGLAFNGRPSSWSAALDKITFGSVFNPSAPQIVLVSGGNVDYLKGNIPDEYPSKNELESIHDPAQAYNALTIGTFTCMDRIDQTIWPGYTCLAPYGKMAPTNSTSLTWDSQWPIKPELVMEGGNLATDGRQIKDNVHVLKPLSLDKDFNNFVFQPFGDTSGATALAAKMAAELKHTYPTFWPETIRGLMVHSADWTNAMLDGISFSQATLTQKRTILRTYGYGVPCLENALYSAKNALTLIAEKTIQPFAIGSKGVKYNEYHLYKIPWPIDILRDHLTDQDVKLKVTLSYFIEPNPGNRRYANNFQYHSHALDFKVIKPQEDLDTFKRRVSAASETGNTDQNYDGSQEPWALREAIRNRGSIKKDFIVSSGADISTRNTIAIYPKSGWYKTRKKLNKVGSIVRYALIVSVESGEIDIDIYSPVLLQIENVVNV